MHFYIKSIEVYIIESFWIICKNNHGFPAAFHWLFDIDEWLWMNGSSRVIFAITKLILAVKFLYFDEICYL